MGSYTARDWRSILLIAASGSGALLGLVVAALLIGMALFSSISGSSVPAGLPMLESILTASAAAPRRRIPRGSSVAGRSSW